MATVMVMQQLQQQLNGSGCRSRSESPFRYDEYHTSSSSSSSLYTTSTATPPTLSTIIFRLPRSTTTKRTASICHPRNKNKRSIRSITSASLFFIVSSMMTMMVFVAAAAAGTVVVGVDGFSPRHLPRYVQNQKSQHQLHKQQQHQRHLYQCQRRHRRRRPSPSSPLWSSASGDIGSTSSSSSATAASQIFEAVDMLYPSSRLEQRVALSRKDGYWPYISKGEEPPLSLVYGEFDLQFFQQVLDRAGQLLYYSDSGSQPPQSSQPPSWWWNDKVFCDLGSGTGRLVVSAAALYRWKLCRGVELLEGIHDEAVTVLKNCHTDDYGSETGVGGVGSGGDRPSSTQQYADDTQYSLRLPTTKLSESSSESSSAQSSTATLPPPEELSPIQAAYFFNPDTTAGHHDTATASPSGAVSSSTESKDMKLSPICLACGSFEDPYQYFGDSDIIFVFSSCMDHHILTKLARGIGRQCRPGTLIMTTEYQLPAGTIQLDPLPDDPDYPSGTCTIELIESITGSNEVTGGESTVFIQRLSHGLGDGKTRRVPPTLPVSEVAYRAVIKVEQENDSREFLRRVSNQMAFVGLPESWRPDVGPPSDDER